MYDRLFRPPAPKKPHDSLGFRAVFHLVVVIRQHIVSQIRASNTGQKSHGDKKFAEKRYFLPGFDDFSCLQSVFDR